MPVRHGQLGLQPSTSSLMLIISRSRVSLLTIKHSDHIWIKTVMPFCSNRNFHRLLEWDGRWCVEMFGPEHPEKTHPPVSLPSRMTSELQKPRNRVRKQNPIPLIWKNTPNKWPPKWKDPTLNQAFDWYFRKFGTCFYFYPYINPSTMIYQWYPQYLW
jgi:hypothetical protein